jgi:flagellar basal body-associated protein FliL
MTQFDPKSENVESTESNLIPGLNGVSPEDDYSTTEEEAPNRAPLILLMVILLIGGGGLFFMHAKSKPNAANANTEAADAGKTINAFLSDGGKSLGKVRELMKNTETMVENFSSHEAEQVKLEELKTNPFEVKKAKVAVAANDDAAAKARAAAIEREKAEITKQAEKLQLQSILYGAGRSTCMISGQAYEVGDKIEGGFRLEAIEKTCVILKKSDYSFKLTMKSN